MSKILEQRHIIYLLLLLAVAVPLVKPVGLPLRVGDSVRMVYDLIEALPNGSTVLMIWDVTPGAFMDVGAGGVAMMAHMFSKNVKIIAVTFVDSGVGAFERALHQVDLTGKVYGEDYVDLGFIAGLEPSLAAVAADLHLNAPVDKHGDSVPAMAITKNIKSVNDVALVISMSTQQPGTEGAVRQIALKYPVPMVSACAAGQATRMWVFLSSGHLKGLLPGLAGGAQYEQLIKRPAYGASSMDAMSALHLYIIGLLVIGNVIHFRGKRKGDRKGAGTA